MDYLVDENVYTSNRMTCKDNVCSMCLHLYVNNVYLCWCWNGFVCFISVCPHFWIWAHVHLHVIMIVECVWICACVLDCVQRGGRKVSKVPGQNNEGKWIPDGLLFLFSLCSMTWGEWQASNGNQTRTLQLWTSPTASNCTVKSLPTSGQHSFPS